MPSAPKPRLTVILHADVVRSTELVQLDEAVAHERIQDTFRRLAGVLGNNSGVVWETRGDAVVAQFERASDAVLAAIAFQSDNKVHNESLEGAIRPQLRIGIALGEVVLDENTVTGAGVVLAQRLEQMAPADGVVVQGAAFEVIPKRLRFGSEDLGEHALKGFGDPVRAYRVYAENPGPEEVRIEAAPSSGHGTSTVKSVLSGATGPSIAVLPFRNLSRDEEQDYFADGISEDITHALSASRSFPVLSPTSTYIYKANPRDAQTAGRELGAKYVVSGSVRRGGERVRVSVELVDADSKVQLWSERYDHTLEDVFAVQDEITTNVACVVQPEIDIREMQRAKAAAPSDVGAYELAQKGFWHLWGGTKGDYLASLRLFQKALALDPTYARAYAGQSQGKFRAGNRLWDDRAVAFQNVLTLARQALQLDDKNPVALRYMGGALANLGRIDEAIEVLQAAVTNVPSYATAYSGLAFALALNGEFDKALESEATTARLRPRDPGMSVCMMTKSVALYQKDDYEAAEAVARESLEMVDGFWLSNLMLVAALGQQGRASEAREARERLATQLPELGREGLRGFLPFRSSEHLQHVVQGLVAGGMVLD